MGTEKLFSWLNIVRWHWTASKHLAASQKVEVNRIKDFQQFRMSLKKWLVDRIKQYVLHWAPCYQLLTNHLRLELCPKLPSTLNLNISWLFLFILQKMLTKGKANPNSLDNQKFSPLHLAAQRGRLDIIQILVRWSLIKQIIEPPAQLTKTPILVSLILISER